MKNESFFRIHPYFPIYDNGFTLFRQGGLQQNAAADAAAFLPLSLAEGLTVGTLVLSGVCLMSAYQNAVQRAVVLTVAVIGALLNSTLNTLVCIAIHKSFLLPLVSALVWLTALK